MTDLGAMVSASNRKMDKTTVLKTTIAFLRQHEELSARNQVIPTGYLLYVPVPTLRTYLCKHNVAGQVSRVGKPVRIRICLLDPEHFSPDWDPTLAL